MLDQRNREARFWLRVNKNGPTMLHMDTPCWTWTGMINNDGYGVYWGERQRNTLCTHAPWLWPDGLQPGMCALHRCDNRACVRPDHLFQGKRADNNADASAKGRMFYQTEPERLRKQGSEHGMAILDEAAVLACRRRFRNGERIVELAREFGMRRGPMRAAIRGITWKHVPEAVSQDDMPAAFGPAPRVVARKAGAG